MKKLKIFLLTLLMVITLLPVNTIAEGEDTSSKEPDLSVFATKDDLMTKFTPNSATGKSDNIAKIKLGRDATNANLIEWFNHLAENFFHGNGNCNTQREKRCKWTCPKCQAGCGTTYPRG